jgi:protein-L-isoaspartate(D-aspartate) O-methyltransferase
MAELNLEQARFNMVEQQIRPWDVLDQRVLDVIAQTPREDFVPEQHRNLAFADLKIPLDHGQVMMPPNLEGRLLQSVSIQPSDTILEIGTGSGYLTACLAKLGGHVHSVDIFPEFKYSAQRKLAAHSIENVTLHAGDAANGWDDMRYDVIVLTASLPVYYDAFQRSLAISGRLFVIVGEPPIMEARLITRVGDDAWAMEDLFETAIPPLINAPGPQRFTF